MQVENRLVEIRFDRGDVPGIAYFTGDLAEDPEAVDGNTHYGIGEFTYLNTIEEIDGIPKAQDCEWYVKPVNRINRNYLLSFTPVQIAKLRCVGLL